MCVCMYVHMYASDVRYTYIEISTPFCRKFRPARDRPSLCFPRRPRRTCRCTPERTAPRLSQDLDFLSVRTTVGSFWALGCRVPNYPLIDFKCPLLRTIRAPLKGRASSFGLKVEGFSFELLRGLAYSEPQKVLTWV